MFLNPEKIIAKEAKASVTDAGNCPCVYIVCLQVGLLMTGVAVAVLWKFWDTPVVRACGRWVGWLFGVEKPENRKKWHQRYD